MSKLSRRNLFKAAGALAAGSLGNWSTASPVPPARNVPHFPRDFVWGCATSSYQIEGAAREDGRGPSIWDEFSHTPGKTHGGDTGDTAADSYHRYAEDVALLKQLGVGAYRFSVSWPRVFPAGRGKPNDKGMAYYDRLVDELLNNGLQPYVTLFHWDLPLALPGGWQSRDTSFAFADYAAYVSGRLSDRVKHFFTTNEFVCITDLGYALALFAPGLKLPRAAANQVRHHAILAHGLGVQAIRSAARSGTQVGLAENSVVYVPVIETSEHIAAARRATRQGNAQFLTAILEGRYTDEYLAQMGADAPMVSSGDMRIIGSPIDFLGLNVYTPEYVRAASTPAGFEVLPRQDAFPHMDSPWLNVGPEVLYWAVRNVCDVWNAPPIYITENGCSAEDVLTSTGRVNDTERVMYLRNHLTHLQRATSEGLPVKGYFLWSLLDNFEWADGYSKRFGLHYVDFKTLKRTPKLSAEWYREVVRRNGLA